MFVMRASLIYTHAPCTSEMRRARALVQNATLTHNQTFSAVQTHATAAAFMRETGRHQFALRPAK